MSELTRDGTDEPVLRDQTLRVNEDREKSLSLVQLVATSRIGNRGLLGNVGEGHDRRGGVLQRQVKMCLGHGPAPGNSI